ncbi:hypothetical protein GJ688_08515 [Heliobacillus mobilis]|uniref:Uncharacterized protein n=1 Tax=Heliobacterium mobile TaxID=28064 RepID=A0A6I3SJH0_HELMO|nr:hypothetical protein [Heliobacterium mobile]MTV49020.1 hypothetical protein [Heliobacterium mobile]
MKTLQLTLTHKFFQSSAEQIREQGVPRCYECLRILHAGDKIDSWWPQSTRQNVCRACEENNAAERRRFAWNTPCMAKPKEIETARSLLAMYRESRQNQKHISDKLLSEGSVDKETFRLSQHDYRSAILSIARAGLPERAWKAAGLTFDEIEEAELDLLYGFTFKDHQPRLVL